ncbi:MAG: hypothetical protein M3Y82_11740 [Verrucomicrobiota bacterium]|nr:hypothetical protein [Verrucomicrobiota bacterium]
MINESSKTPRFAWQPLTPHGVAAFAFASWPRLYLAELFFGLLAMTSLIWFLNRNISPAISEALQQLPETAVLQNGELKNLKSKTLASGKILSLMIDLEENIQTGQTVDLQIEFGKKQFKICGLLGCLDFNYPADQTMALGRSKSDPWWGAWRPIILAGIALAFLLFLFFYWAIFSTLCFSIPKIFAYFADRELSWPGSWRLASAAQMPGAFLFAAAIFLYGLNMIDLIHFGILLGLHFISGWIYLGAAPFFLPRISETLSAQPNPFSMEN